MTVREKRAEKLAKAALDYLKEVGDENRGVREWLALTSWDRIKKNLANRFLEILP